jgi:hypothetical protein
MESCRTPPNQESQDTRFDNISGKALDISKDMCMALCPTAEDARTLGVLPSVVTILLHFADPSF